MKLFHENSQLEYREENNSQRKNNEKKKPKLALCGHPKFNDTSFERKMKSTNRQFRLEVNPIKNYFKMCLLNCILISIVTLTHSLPIQTRLSSAIAEHPKFGDTLLNPAVVPFVKECETNKLNKKQEMLCGSYLEMIKKLDDSKVNGLTTIEDFTEAMSVYNQTQVEDFCAKFPGYIPHNDGTDQKQYPDSFKLYTHVNKPVTCQALCGDDADIDHVVVQPICRVFAIGFQLSNTKVQPQLVNPIKNSTVNPSAEGIPNSDILQPEITSKSESTPGSVKLDDTKSPAALPINSIDAVKQLIDGTGSSGKIDEKSHKEKTDGLDEKTAEENNDEFDEKILKENFSPNVDTAAEGSQKNGIGDSDGKSIDSTSNIKHNQTPTVKQDLKLAEKVSNPSESSMPNAETAEKPALNAEQSLVDLNPENPDEELVKDEDDKGIEKVATDDNDGFDDSDVNAKDSSENNDGIDDGIDSPPKSPPDQSPSKEQLHSEEDPFTDDTDSNFFTYFMFLLFVCVIAYVVYHNKSKMLALLLEGRRSNTNGRSGLSRRKHTAAYRKLDSNLEEAITSSGNGRSTQVIY